MSDALTILVFTALGSACLASLFLHPGGKQPLLVAVASRGHQGRAARHAPEFSPRARRLARMYHWVTALTLATLAFAMVWRASLDFVFDF